MTSCTYIIPFGSRKGEMCCKGVRPSAIVNGEIHCAIHRSAILEKNRMRAMEAYVPRTSAETVCDYVGKRGQRRGQVCGSTCYKKDVDGTYKCGIHSIKGLQRSGWGKLKQSDSHTPCDPQVFE